MRLSAVPILVTVLVAAALAVLWLTPTTAYGPEGRTRCGPALQELAQTFNEVRGRCHLVRQERMRVGLGMAGAMAVAGLGVWLVDGAVNRRRSGPRGSPGAG